MPIELLFVIAAAPRIPRLLFEIGPSRTAEQCPPRSRDTSPQARLVAHHIVRL
jgi:hypothetical protein